MANSKIQKINILKIGIQPASGDAGGSVGSALAVWHNYLNKRVVYGLDKMKGTYLGPVDNTFAIEKLDEIGAKYDLRKMKMIF